MPATDIPGLALQATTLMQQRLGARGDSLEQAVRARGWRLPRKVRRAAVELAEAEPMAAHPRLRLMLDEAQVERSGRLLVNYLHALGASERRWRLFLSVAASVSFALLVTIAGVISVLVWRGYL
ncbi:MAG: hypothetical protein JJU15_11385 [Pararhodobacter sp.]|nr:hypothetical protein [Pararhodobacter sp.]